MNSKNVAYWLSTGLVAFAFAFGGAADLAGAPAVTAGFEHLGYPAYLAGLLGVWKLLGAAAILAPGWPRLKEWAYAGMFFDLSGAAYSHAMVGDPPGNILTPLVITVLLIASWALRSEGRTWREAKTSRAVTGAPELARAKG